MYTYLIAIVCCIGAGLAGKTTSLGRVHSLSVKHSQILTPQFNHGNVAGTNMVAVDKMSTTRDGITLSWVVDGRGGATSSISIATVELSGVEHVLPPCKLANPEKSAICTVKVPLSMLVNQSGLLRWSVKLDDVKSIENTLSVDGPSVLLPTAGFLQSQSKGRSLGSPDGWQASWIGGFTQARADFTISLEPGETVDSAVVDVSTPGTVSVYAWCGAPITDAALLSDDIAMPGVSTNPAQRTLYRALPIPSGCWREGGPVSLGFRLGLARYGYLDMWCTGMHGANSSCRALIAEATVVTSSGRVLTVAASGAGGAGLGSWSGTTSQSGWTYSHMYHGETIEASAGIQGGLSWMDPSFNASIASGWAAVSAWDTASQPLGQYGVTLHDLPTISARSQPPVQPISVTAVPPINTSAGWWPQGNTADSDRPLVAEGALAYVFDLGQNYAVTAALRIDLGPPGSVARKAADGLFVAVRHSEFLLSQGPQPPTGNASLLLQPQFYPCTPLPLPPPPPSSSLVMAGDSLGSQGQHNCANQTLAIRLTSEPQQWGAIGQADVESLQGLPTSTLVGSMLTWSVGRYIQVEGLFNPAAGVQFQPSEIPNEEGGTFWIVGRPTHSAVQPVDSLHAGAEHKAGAEGNTITALSSSIGIIAGHRASRSARIVAGQEVGVNGYDAGGLLGAIAQTQVNVLQSVPMDCANRERRGWGGDMQWTCGYAQQSLDATEFYSNYMRTLLDTQRVGCVWPADGVPAPGGQICSPSSISPVDWPSNRTQGTVGVFEPASHGLPGIDPSWTTMTTEIPYQAWAQTGLTAVAKEGYAQAKALLEYLEAQADPSLTLVRFGVFGDWSPPTGLPRPPTELVSSFAHLVALSRGVTLASLVGDTASATAWQNKIDSAAPLWHSRYWNASQGAYGLWTSSGLGTTHQLVQGGESVDRWAVSSEDEDTHLVTGAIGALLTPQVLGVYVGTILTNGSGMPAGAVGALTSAIQRYGHSWSVGTVGARYILEALAACGSHDDAVALVMHDGAPGFAFMLENGPGTIWEHWEFGPVNATSGQSQSHIMDAGGVGLYLRALAGAAVPVTARSLSAAHIANQAAALGANEHHSPSSASSAGEVLSDVVAGPDAAAARAWFRHTCGSAGSSVDGRSCSAGGYSSTVPRHSTSPVAINWTISEIMAEHTTDKAQCGSLAETRMVVSTVGADRGVTVLMPAPTVSAACSKIRETALPFVLRVCELPGDSECQDLATITLSSATGMLQTVQALHRAADWHVAELGKPATDLQAGHGVAVVLPQRGLQNALLMLTPSNAVGL